MAACKGGVFEMRNWKLSIGLGLVSLTFLLIPPYTTWNEAVCAILGVGFTALGIWEYYQNKKDGEKHVQTGSNG